MRSQLLLAWLAVLALGCEGVLGGAMSGLFPPDGTSDAGRPGSFDCVPGSDPSPEQVLRLTTTQYRRTLDALLARAFPEPERGAVFSRLEASFARLPVDGSTHKAELVWDSMDQRVSSLLVGPQLDIATGIGSWVAEDASRLGRFATAFGGAACATSTADAACVDAVIDGFGRRALRRPLDAEDRASARGAYDDATWGGYPGLIASFLLAPDFIFRTEFRGEAVDGRTDLTRLTPFELANRAAFTLTNAMPDEALLEAAARNFEGVGFTLEAQVARLLATPEAASAWRHFYTQWLRPDRVPGFNPSAASVLGLPYPDGSALPLAPDTDLAQLRLDAFTELLELMTWTSTHGRSLGEALTTDVSFARTPTLARLYGVPPWTGDDAQLVRFPAGQRAGLFTRAGYLLSGYPDSNPVMRGARLRVEYLCDDFEPPANTSPPASYVPPSVPTVRNLVQAKTEIPGTACAGCHEHLINPLGFPLETYDAFGRFRTLEATFDGSGAVSAWVPVASATAPNIDLTGDPTEAADGVALSRLLAASPRLHQCFARHVFRARLGRHESTTADACVLGAMERAAGEGSLEDVVRALVTSPAFTLRRLPPGN